MWQVRRGRGRIFQQVPWKEDSMNGWGWGESPHWRHHQGNKCPSLLSLGQPRALSLGHPGPPFTGDRWWRQGRRPHTPVGGVRRLAQPKQRARRLGVAGSLLLPSRPAGQLELSRPPSPSRVLISGRQLLGITLTEWFCLPAFSTVRRPRAMDQRQGSGAQRTGRGSHADPAGSPLPSPTAPTPAQTQVLWAPRTCASPGCGPGISELDRSQRD